VRRMLREATPAGQPVPALAPEVTEWLAAWRWPGNLRELRNVIEYARAVCSGGYIQLADLPDALQAAARELAHASPAPSGPNGPHGTHGPLPAEAQLLLQYLRAAHWNVAAVARQLGVARMTLYRRMKRWGIEPGGRSG
jgi:sigma-54 dependent transcriptional regulator, acetoin dehydrogenase operon transcriptional activator AcoR